MLLVAAASTVAQTPEQGAPPRAEASEMVQWPVVRSRDVKAEHQQNLKDMARMTQLVADLRKELSDERMISVSAVKKAEEIEKLIKRVRSRLR
jgi:hypothetical protein